MFDIEVRELARKLQKNIRRISAVRSSEQKLWLERWLKCFTKFFSKNRYDDVIAGVRLCRRKCAAKFVEFSCWTVQRERLERIATMFDMSSESEQFVSRTNDSEWFIDRLINQALSSDIQIQECHAFIRVSDNLLEFDLDNNPER